MNQINLLGKLTDSEKIEAIKRILAEVNIGKEYDADAFFKIIDIIEDK